MPELFTDHIKWPLVCGAERINTLHSASLSKRSSSEVNPYGY